MTQQGDLLSSWALLPPDAPSAWGPTSTCWCRWSLLLWIAALSRACSEETPVPCEVLRPVSASTAPRDCRIDQLARDVKRDVSSDLPRARSLERPPL